MDALTVGQSGCWAFSAWPLCGLVDGWGLRGLCAEAGVVTDRGGCLEGQCLCGVMGLAGGGPACGAWPSDEFQAELFLQVQQGFVLLGQDLELLVPAVDLRAFVGLADADVEADSLVLQPGAQVGLDGGQQLLQVVGHELVVYHDFAGLRVEQLDADVLHPFGQGNLFLRHPSHVFLPEVVHAMFVYGLVFGRLSLCFWCRGLGHVGLWRGRGGRLFDGDAQSGLLDHMHFLGLLLLGNEAGGGGRCGGFGWLCRRGGNL